MHAYEYIKLHDSIVECKTMEGKPRYPLLQDIIEHL